MANLNAILMKSNWEMKTRISNIVTCWLVNSNQFLQNNFLNLCCFCPWNLQNQIFNWDSVLTKQSHGKSCVNIKASGEQKQQKKNVLQWRGWGRNGKCYRHESHKTSIPIELISRVPKFLQLSYVPPGTLKRVTRDYKECDCIHT